jgi:CPA1 family monovalent cation:H+ antiporter
MEFTTTIIILLLAIVISNLLDKTFPGLPLPLIQIVCGVLLALTPFAGEMELNPHVFMMLLVAPILFREAEDADLVALWRVRKQVILFAFLLVFLTVVAIGLSVHWMTPAVPLAACFALGAILGPTDAIAVTSISSRVTLDKKLMTTLKGEGLINDASGVISFNFAVAALLTGSFSLVNASLRFLLVCAGGLVAGLLLVALKESVTGFLRKSSVHSTPTFMMIEILTPFLCYLLAEAVQVSGIIAAVAAGTRQAIRFHRAERFDAELGVFKKFFWEMLLMSFNAIVFLLLGLQLPGVVRAIIESQDYGIGFTLLLSLFVTAILLGVRFAGVLLLARDVTGSGIRNTLRDSLILTLSGVKGTVSLATAFSLPLMIGNADFVQRPLLLFITAAVIIFSLLLAVGLLPFLAKAPVISHQNAAHIAVLNDVVTAITQEGGRHTSAVVVSLRSRIRELENQDFGHKEKKDAKALRALALRSELAFVQARYEQGEVRDEVYQLYLRILENIYGASAHRAFQEAGIQLQSTHPLRFWFFLGRWIKMHKMNRKGDPRGDMPSEETCEKMPAEPGAMDAVPESGPHHHWDPAELQQFFWENTDRVIATLEGQKGEKSEVVIGHFIEERLELSSKLTDDLREGIGPRRLLEVYDRELLRGFELERAIIKNYEAEGRISMDEADKMRIDVNLIESYMLEDRHENPLKKLLSKAEKKRTEMRKGRRLPPPDAPGAP